MRKDFLSIRDLNRDEFGQLIELTKVLKAEQDRSRSFHRLKGKTLGMIFVKSSTRTRVSFEVGMYQLGGYSLFLNQNDIQLGRGETIPDTARVLSRYVDAIMIRTFDHDDVIALAKHATIPVINGLTDLLHPCQVLSDLFSIIERKGSLKGLRIAYVGDGNNLANSWLNAAALVPIDLRLAVPQGYEPDRGILESVEKTTMGTVHLYHNPEDAVRGADVVYTDVWASMGREKEADIRRVKFSRYQVNKRLMSLADNNVVVMHCLPAHRGEEITDDVLDGDQSIVWAQAENRLHVQKAIMVKLMAQ